MGWGCWPALHGELGFAHPSMNRGSRTRLRVPLIVALGLHASLLWFAVHTPSRVIAPPFRDVSSDGVVWLEESRALEPAPTADSTAERGTESAEPGAASPRATSRAPRPAGQAAAANGSDATPEVVAGPAPSSGGDSDSADGVPSGEAAGEPGVAEGPALSLDQLGIGKNPFLQRPGPDSPEGPRKPKDRTREFKRALATELAAADQRVGLGPEGPVLTRLEQETRKTDTAATSSARFRATTDHTGRVTSFELLDATNDRKVWEALAGRMLKGLAGVVLRIPKTGHGVTLDMKVSSEVLLPSGAEPGMGIEVAGIELKKAGGKHSPKISVLKVNPRIEQRQIRQGDGRVVSLPYIEIMDYLNLAGDPVDIGKKAQRVVHARLERLSANAEPDASAEPN